MLALYLKVLKTDEDRQLITEVYDLYWRKMMAAALRLVNKQELAEEAVHECFLKIVQEPEKLRAVAPEKRAAWLMVMAANTARDILEKEGRFGVPQNEVFWEQQPAEDKTAERDFLIAEIDRMPEKYREPLELFYLFGYHTSEIAKMLGISVDNVKQRLSRGRKMLRERLEENF